MSRNGVIAILVVIVAAVLFGYIAFKSSETSSSTATEPPAAGSPSVADQITRGERLFNQFRCNVCHSTTGGGGAGPSLVGLAGSQVKLTNGQTVVADTQYLRQSIINPDAQIVAGYGPSVMSAATDPFMAQITQDSTVAALVAYIESLK